MIELLVQVRSGTNPDNIYSDVKLFKRGDVIVSMTPDWPWSHEEQTSPSFRILKMSDEHPDDGESLITGELNDIPQMLQDDENPMLQVRGFYLDLDVPGIPAKLAAYLADDSRKNPYFVVTATMFTIAQWKRQRPKVRDPRVIG